MRIINKTPHSIRVVGETGEVIREFPPEGEPIRLQEEEEFYGMVGGIPIFDRFLKEADLPPQEDDTYYIVSLPVALAYPEQDFLVPTGYIRDEEGRIIGCKGLARIGRQVK